jgi:periplasmic protein TonB
MVKILLILFLSIVFGSVQAQDSTQRDSTEAKVYMVVEHTPEFPGGYEELMNFIRKNLRVPAKDRDFGAVYTTFVIDEEGNVRDIKVIRGGSKEFNDHVISVFQSMPKWKPGMQDGKRVAVQFTLPIKIHLN